MFKHQLIKNNGEHCFHAVCHVDMKFNESISITKIITITLRTLQPAFN